MLHVKTKYVIYCTQLIINVACIQYISSLHFICITNFLFGNMIYAFCVNMENNVKEKEKRLYKSIRTYTTFPNKLEGFKLYIFKNNFLILIFGDLDFRSVIKII